MLVVGFRISPIIATLAVGSMLEGTALVFSGGAPTGAAPPSLAAFVNGRFVGLPPIVWFLAALRRRRNACSSTAAASDGGCSAIGYNEWVARLSGREDRAGDHRSLRAERLLRSTRRPAARRLHRPGLLRHGQALPARLDRSRRARRNQHHRRTRPLYRNSRRRSAVHGAEQHAREHVAAGGSPQHHLRPGPARRRRDAARENNHADPMEEAHS